MTPFGFQRNTIKSLLLLLLAGVLASCEKPQEASLAEMQAFIDKQDISKELGDWKQKLVKPPQIKFTQGKKYYWDLNTNQGKMSIELYPQYAPMHVSSTMYLTMLGFYDDLIFHRVINNFMAQGGDPLGAGIGNPGYFYDGEFHQDAKHDKAGVLSMANRGPNTDGSQFFITFKATPHLNGRHTVFGQLVGGEDTLKKIESLGSYSGKTKQEVKILKATIRVE